MPRQAAALRLPIFTLVSLLPLVGCAEAIGPRTDVEETGSLQRVTPAALEGAPGFPLADSIVVRAVDRGGQPLEGAPVVFTVTGGGGTVSPASVTSDAAGEARAQWVLGGAEGENQLEVRVDGNGSEVVTFTAAARLGPESRIEAISGATSVVPVGCALPEPLVVRVTDAGGTPVSGALVSFGLEGAPASDGVSIRTDAQGLGRHNWRLTSPADRIVARIAAPAAGTVTFDVTGAPIAPGGYATVGNRVYGAGCVPHRFVGVARPGLQWWPDEVRLSDPQLSAQEFETMRSWGANVVRLPVYQRFWLRDLVHEGVTYRKETYQGLVRGLVERANAAGLDVIIDLHASDRGDPNFPDTVADIQQMADVNHSIPFWREVAAAFRDNGRVIFQLYNEPNQIDWEVWRNGGTIPGGDTFPPQSSGVEFQAAGMQDLYEAVRSAGADNLVVVNGTHWGYYLSRVPDYALDGYNIMYASHPYDYPDKQAEKWEADWGFLAESHPVMIAEFGDYICNRDGYFTRVLDYADSKQLSWVAWAWWAPPPDSPELICEFPALIVDWAGTPSPQGQVVRDRMRGYAE